MDEDVAAEIKKMGYEIVPQVGCSGYRIDIGVIDPVNPGSFLIGVECDGATYKSGSSARDRDRLREQVLRQLGWRIHRIWSPSWVARRDSEIRRLKDALEQAQQLQLEKDTQKPIIDVKADNAPSTDLQKNQFGGIEKIGIPYKIQPLKATFNPYIKIATRQHQHLIPDKKTSSISQKTEKSKHNSLQNSCKKKAQFTMTTPLNVSIRMGGQTSDTTNNSCSKRITQQLAKRAKNST